MTGAPIAPAPPSGRRWLLLALPAPALLIVTIGWLQVEYRRSEAVRAQAVASSDNRLMLVTLLSRVGETDPADDDVGAARLDAERLIAALAANGADVADIAPLVRQRLAEAQRPAGETATAVRLRVAVAHRIAAERRKMTERSARFARQRALLYTVLTVIGAAVLIALIGAQALLWRYSRLSWRATLDRFEAAERAAAILDRTHDALLIVAPDGRIDMVNPAAAALLGCKDGELIGRAVDTVIDDLPRGDDAPTFVADRRAGRCDGGTIVVDVALAHLHMPRGDHLILSLRDRSERRRIEQAKDELIATISHELRTPLTSVIGSLTLLRVGAATGMTPEMRRLIDVADANSRRLVRLINDLLDMDRIDAGRLTIVPVPLDLRDVLDEAQRAAEGLARAAGVRILLDRPDQPVPVAADRERLQQVVANLLVNALHVAPEGSHVSLGVTIEVADATVYVDDRGPGVPAELRDRLFERFQTRGHGRHGGGAGLGLAISREIVQRHGGRILFGDRPGGGTRFSFTMPLHRTSPATPVPPAAGRPLILHVEDDDDLRALVATAIAPDAEVAGVGTLAAARALLRRRTPMAAILDMQVVDGHGGELIPLLEDDGGRPIPFAILSGGDVPVEVAARADTVIRKGPDAVPALLTAIRRMLAAR